MAMSRAKLTAEFNKLLAPRLLRALRADARGTIPLRAPQRSAILSMLRAFMPAGRLKRVLSAVRRGKKDKLVRRSKRGRRRNRK